MIHWLGLMGVALGVETTDLTGVWESESGSQIMVPMMRDGRMPIVLMGRQPTVLVGDWKWDTQSLEIKGASIYIKDHNLIVKTAGKETVHTLHHPIQPAPQDGVWFLDNVGEFMLIQDVKRTWMLHVPLSQQGTIQKAKAIKGTNQFRFKWEGRCFIDFSYEPEQSDLTMMVCPDRELELIRIDEPVPFQTANWSGSWRSFTDWTMHVQMTGQHFDRFYIESADTIIDFQASWMGGSNGRKVLLERKGAGNALGLVDPVNPDIFILRMEGEEILFEKE
jgi:hypothetical protein